MTHARRTIQSTLAVVVGLILIAQTSLAVAGAGMTKEMVDAFGNPLCITSTTAAVHGAHPSLPSEHKPATSCCTLGCGTTGPSAPAPDGEASGLPRPPASTILPSPAGTQEAHGPVTAHDPASPRAPPPAV